MPNIWLAVPDVPMPVPPLVIGRAVARVNEEADKAPVKVPPPCELIPEPAQILPLIPMPPATITEPEVDEVELVFDTTCMTPKTVMPVPTFKFPETPTPPVTTREPEVDEVELVLSFIVTTPKDWTVDLRTVAPVTPSPPTIFVLLCMASVEDKLTWPVTPRPPKILVNPDTPKPPVIFVFPITCSLNCGVLVPTPMLPENSPMETVPSALALNNGKPEMLLIL